MIRKAEIFVQGNPAGILEEISENDQWHWRFLYHSEYDGAPVSLSLPLGKREFEFKNFPSFFDGLLPEGLMLDALIRNNKIDKNDYFSQLIAVGADLVGAVTVKAMVEK